MPIDYTYLGEKEILARIVSIDQALDRGSQTEVGIEPRISHSFDGKSDSEMRVRRDEYGYALFQIALESRDAVMLKKYKNPYNRAGITRPNFC